MRLIDADAVGSIENLDNYSAFAAGLGTVRDVQDVLIDAPTIDAEPVVHAHWVKSFVPYESSGVVPEWHCSACRVIRRYFSSSAQYCCCGAKMDEEVVK